MQRERLPGSQDGEELASFFIPSVTLKGARDDRLRDAALHLFEAHMNSHTAMRLARSIAARLVQTRLSDTDDALLIPSVTLAGSREAKLRQLDGALSRLNAVRRSLAAGNHSAACTVGIVREAF